MQWSAFPDGAPTWNRRRLRSIPAKGRSWRVGHGADDRARKRTIITGGTGLIGWALAAELVTRGHEVMVLSRSPGRVGGLPKGVRAERWDGRSAAGWGPLVEGATAIVNVAVENLAEGRWSGERK
jgi:hypothetical protein